jgi:hypothetical protein
MEILKAFFHLLKASKSSNSQFFNVLDLIKFDPRISRIDTYTRVYTVINYN